MTSWRQELALAAARTRLLLEEIPEAYRPDVGAPWQTLIEELDACHSDGGKVLAIIEFRGEMETTLAAALAHAPLERSR